MKPAVYIIAYLLVVLLMCSSCQNEGPRTDVVAVNSVMPVLNVPAKPQLDLMTADELTEYAKLSSGLRAKLQGNDEKLKEYSMQLKVTLETYDDFAKTHNANGSGIQVQAISPTVSKGLKK